MAEVEESAEAAAESAGASPWVAEVKAEEDSPERYRRVGRSSALYLIGAVFARLSKFLLVPFYVRFLTQAEVGTVVFLTALSAALYRFFPLGLNQAVKRYYPEFKTRLEADQYTAGLWWVVLGLSLFWSVLSWLTVPLWGSLIDASIPAGFLLLAVAAAAFQGNSAVPTVRYIARQEPKGHMAYTTGELLLVTIAVLVLVAGFDMGVAGVLWGMIGGYLVWSAMSGVLINRWAGWRPRVLRLRESLRYSVAVVPHLLFVWGITFADRILLVRFVSLEDVAIYGVGYQLGTTMTVFTVAVTNAWMARFYRAYEGEEGAREFGRTLTRMVMVLLWLTLAVIALAPEIIAVVATPEYASSVEVLQLTAVAYIFQGLNLAFLLPLFLKEATGRVSTSTGLGLAVNIGLNLLLLPWIGIFGAAIATVAAFLVIAVTSYKYAQDVYPFALEAWPLGVSSVLFVTLGAASLTIGDIGVWTTAGRVLLVIAFPLALWAWPGRAVLRPGDRAAVHALINRYLRRG